MKKAILGLLLALASHSLSAQVLDEINLSEKTEIEYIKIMGYDMGVFKKKVIIIVDYGQKIKLGDDTSVKDSEGKTKIFNSMIDALNFFYGYGWEFVNAYAISEGQSGQVYHWVLRRKQSK